MRRFSNTLGLGGSTGQAVRCGLALGGVVLPQAALVMLGGGQGVFEAGQGPVCAAAQFVALALLVASASLLAVDYVRRAR